MAVYRVSFAIQTETDPEEWFWPALVEPFNSDGDKVIMETIVCQEVIV